MSIEFGEVNKYDQTSQFPVVDLVFTGPKKSLVDRVSGNAAQFTRNTIGTYVGADGLIKTAAAGELRYTYDPLTGEELGLLVEESRTNYLTNSSALHTWPIVFGPIITANATSAPDGTITATSLVPALGQANQIFLPNFDNKRNLSVFAKADGYDHIILVAQSAPSTSAGVLFNLTGDGNVVATNYGATGSIQKLANGWYRCTMTRSSTDVATMNAFIIRAADSSTPDSFNYFFQSSFVGDGTSGVYIWGAQHEEGAFPTSYIPTTTSTITRDPDTITLTNNNIYNKEKFDIINDPFGMSAGSDTLTLLPSASNSSVIKRATIFSPNIAQSKINTFANKTDEFWRWRVTGTSFGLPQFSTDGQVTVDWGDGTVETLTTSDHTYTDGKAYHEIGFRLDSGTYMSILINGSIHKDKVVAIGPAPESMVVNPFLAFKSCTNLVAFDPSLKLITQSAIQAWISCNKLKSFPLIDTSNITNFSSTWRDCTSLTTFPLINTAAGTNFNLTWSLCSSLTSFPLIDTSSGTDFGGAWRDCTSLTSFPLLDTSSGTIFSVSWYNCTSLTSFPLLNTAAGTTFANAWYNCNSLTSFPLINTAAGTNFSFAWQGCSSLTSFPLIDTSSGTNFTSAWQGCSSLTTFPSIDTSSGTSFVQTWRNCSSLTSFPVINISSGTSFNAAWENCNSLSSFPSNFFDSWTGTPANNCFGGAWKDCSSLTATSVENILNSIDTSGQSAPASGVDITITYNASSGTPNISTAVSNLKSRGWTITLNGVAQ